MLLTKIFIPKTFHDTNFYRINLITYSKQSMSIYIYTPYIYMQLFPEYFHMIWYRMRQVYYS